MTDKPNGQPAPAQPPMPEPYIKVTPQSGGMVRIESNISSWEAIAQMLTVAMDVAITERTKRKLEKERQQAVVVPSFMMPPSPFKV